MENSLGRLLELGALPVVNENDAVGTDEIGVSTTIGENDTLAAIVAQLAQADLLVILSDIEGLYTADPHRDPTARLIPVVEEVTPEIEALAGGTGSALALRGDGHQAAGRQAGRPGGLRHGHRQRERPQALYDIAQGRPAGTRFLGKKPSDP